MTKFSLEGKKVLITGGSSGIGRAIAIEFAKFGADVVVNYNSSKKNAEEVVEIIKSLGRNAIAVQANVTDEQQVINLINKAVEFGDGKIDVLVNSAGNIFGSALVSEMDESLWKKTIDVDMTSVFLACKHVIPIMKRQNSGRIISMSSVAAHNGGGAGTTPYAASKAAVQAFSKGLAKELAPNILVNCIAPGVIDTRIHQAYISKEGRINNLQRIPLRREGKPEEITGAAILLASEYGSYITGETIEINGGLNMD